MPIRAVIFDVSHTLINERNQVPAEGAVAALQRLRNLGILIVAAHNDGPRVLVEHLLNGAGLLYDLVVTQQETHVAKGSPVWIEYVQNALGVARNELLYVGDSKLDMITASHGQVIFFHAAWGKDAGGYGFPISSITALVDMVEHIFLKSHNWWWKLDETDKAGRPLRQFSLMDAGYNGPVKSQLMRAFKDDSPDAVVNSNLSVKDFTLLHILAGLYAEGITFDKDTWWTIYPSSTPGEISPISEFWDKTAKEFRAKYIPDLFVRAQQATHSRNARGYNNQTGKYNSDLEGIKRAFNNQLTTVHLNSNYRTDVQGRRIILFDDFVTKGPSSHTARSLALAAGASEVIITSVGKYGTDIYVSTCEPSGSASSSWNVFQPLSDIGDISLDLRRHFAVADNAALTTFLASYDAMSNL
jgi:hypothetical protein